MLLKVVLVVLPCIQQWCTPLDLPVITVMRRVGEKSMERNQEPGNRHHDENLKESGLFHSQKEVGRLNHAVVWMVSSCSSFQRSIGKGGRIPAPHKEGLILPPIPFQPTIQPTATSQVTSHFSELRLFYLFTHGFP